MSSRALKKKHGRNDLEAIEKSLQDKENQDESDEGSSQGDGVHIASSKKNNIFSLAALGVEEMSDNENENSDGEVNEETVPQPVTKRKKKKNKKKRKKDEDVEDDLDALLAQAAQAPAPTITKSSNQNSFNPLAVNLKYLNPANEMKRKFGQKVVGGVDLTRRRQHKTHKKATHMVSPADGWHPITKSGLEMCLIGQEGESQIFSMEHRPEYQKIQHKFWDAVDTMAPENLMAVLQLHPYHIDTLLQLSEVCRMSEDPQMAADLIERALYAYESSFHPLFNMTTGKSVLRYNVWENRGLFLALFRHLINIGNRGCYRTSLEYCKLLLGLDPDTDPLCALLLIDFYALRSDEYTYLIQLYNLWDTTRNLRNLPNFAYSVPLAHFYTSQTDTPEREAANDMLQETLMKFPGVLQPLLEACNIDTDTKKDEAATKFHEQIKKNFGAHIHFGQPASLKQLVNLYIGRTSSCWKAPECIDWLLENVGVVCAIAESEPSRFRERSDAGRELYKGKAPPNVCRHLLISDIKNATADLPREVTAYAVLSYDPLPPADTTKSYTRQSRQERQISNQGFLTAFINSLRPDFDINAVVDRDALAVEGAAGGQGLRDVGGNVMNAIREMLQNIEFAPPERDDENEQDPPPQNWD